MTGIFRETSPAGDEAIYSPDMRHRYLLTRDLRTLDGPVLGCVGLNPSTADAFDDDPTIRKIRGYGRRWGFPRLLMGNLFGFRSTDPKGLRTADDPVGPPNAEYLEQIVRDADRVLVAWGACNVSRAVRERASAQATIVCELARKHGKTLYALRETKDGHPYHPLYLRGDLEPTVWQAT